MSLKRHSSSVELLPHDVVELILERLPVETLLLFKSVSKNWNSTIGSRRFHERQLARRIQSRGLDVLFVALGNGKALEKRKTVLGSSIISTARFPTSSDTMCHGSCDGLICLSSVYYPSLVINPATRWHRSFPQSNFQRLQIDSYNKGDYNIPNPKLAFGKDKFEGKYKPVWLYNSSEFGLDNVTTCEVLDLGTNAWRYVLPASPYRIVSYHAPVYLDGTLYWFTECGESKVLSFDLHTETFQIISKTPFVHINDPPDVNMCILDNRLCVSEKNPPTQDIWSYDSSDGNTTWEKIYSIDLTKTYTWFGILYRALTPIAILDKNKLLLHNRGNLRPLDPLVIRDLNTKSYDLLFEPTTTGYCVYYFQSLFSF